MLNEHAYVDSDVHDLKSARRHPGSSLHLLCKGPTVPMSLVKLCPFEVGHLVALAGEERSAARWVNEHHGGAWRRLCRNQVQRAHDVLDLQGDRTSW